MAVFVTFLSIAAAVYLGLGLMLLLFQDRMVYIPFREWQDTPRAMGLEYEDVTLIADDGVKLSAWYVPARPADENDRQWTILFCHGNAGNISHRLDTLALFYKMGMHCLIVDYRGYGKSEGKPSESGTLLDIKAGWDWLIEAKSLEPHAIMIFGRSLGGPIAAITARNVKPGAVVVESTFTSAVDMGQHLYPWMPIKWFARYDYNTLEAIQEVKCPVLVIHSPEDEMIPYSFGKEIYAAAPEPKLFRDLKGTHNEGIYDNAELYEQIWREWFEYLNSPALDNEGTDTSDT